MLGLCIQGQLPISKRLLAHLTLTIKRYPVRQGLAIKRIILWFPMGNIPTLALICSRAYYLDSIPYLIGGVHRVKETHRSPPCPAAPGRSSLALSSFSLSLRRYATCISSIDTRRCWLSNKLSNSLKRCSSLTFWGVLPYITAHRLARLPRAACQFPGRQGISQSANRHPQGF